MGVPATYLFLAQEPRVRLGRPLEPAARGRRRRADARGTAARRGTTAASTSSRATGSPKRRRTCSASLPRRRGGSWASPASPTRMSTSRCATPRATRSSTAPRRASSSSAVRTSSRGTGATRRPRTRCSATAGSRRATSSSGTTRASTASWVDSTELVISGGENVYPAELEDVLHDHPAVAEAAVVGVPDERWGEACAAFVVLHTSTSATEDELRAHCRERLARFKVPRSVTFVESLPRSSLGQGAEGRAARFRHRGRLVSDTLTGVDGRPLSARGERTRRRLLEAAEAVFAELGYHDASIVKLTESAGVGQGTFYLYFASKKEIFDELVVDLNHRVRHAMTEAASQGTSRAEMERLGFAGYFRFVAEHPALYRIIRQAEFVSPEMLHLHYERLDERLRRGPPPGDGGRRDRQGRPGVACLGADGDRRACRNALDPLERARRASCGGARRPRPHHHPHDRLPGREHVSGVGILATAHYLPERRMTAAEIGAASGIPEDVDRLEVRAARQAHRRRRRARERPRRRRRSSLARRARDRSRLDRRARLLRLDLEGLRRLAGRAVDRAPARLRERIRDRVRQRLDGHAGRAPLRACAAHGRARARHRAPRRRLPRVVSPRLRERAVAVHVQLRRRGGGRAARRSTPSATSCSAPTRSPTARSRSRSRCLPAAASSPPRTRRSTDGVTFSTSRIPRR